MIVIEDLKAKNLQKNHHLAKAIANASWYQFRTMMEYKCDWYGKQLITVNHCDCRLDSRPDGQRVAKQVL
ncbi:IS200/IS605 family element transposase accessory protein TnpB [Limosilactobacillus fermentum]|nr:IS200/IS605 family element transposase accessory protein TnpB [Limosilactobacillus fermentum]